MCKIILYIYFSILFLDADSVFLHMSSVVNLGIYNSQNDLITQSSSSNNIAVTVHNVLLALLNVVFIILCKSFHVFLLMDHLLGSYYL